MLFLEEECEGQFRGIRSGDKVMWFNVSHSSIILQAQFHLLQGPPAFSSIGLCGPGKTYPHSACNCETDEPSSDLLQSFERLCVCPMDTFSTFLLISGEPYGYE